MPDQRERIGAGVLGGRAVVALALESAISAELVLFAVFLLAHKRGRSAALYFLSALALLFAAVLTGNLAIAAWHWGRLSDAILFFDLLIPAATYLYVRQSRSPEPPVGAIDALNVLPAAFGAGLWGVHLIHDMDV